MEVKTVLIGDHIAAFNIGTMGILLMQKNQYIDV
jgi:hypothetical protein